MTKRILMLTSDAAGNWPPELQLIRLLVERGHSVRVVSNQQHSDQATGAGAVFEPYEIASSPDVSDRIPVSEQPVRAVRGWLLNDAFGEELARAVDRQRPDVLLLDPMLRMAFPVAQQSGVPVVAMAHTLFGAGFGQERMPPLVFDGVNRKRERLGLAPLADALAQSEQTAAILCFSWHELDTEPSRPIPQLRHVGPLLDTSGDTFASPWEEADTRPLVLVGFSTSYQGQLEVLQRVAQALATLPVRGLITLGHVIKPDELNAPANVRLLPFVPHTAVLPDASLVLTHAGHGTVVAAATYGVPVLCMPMGRDQPAVAAAAQRAGIAHVISPESSSEEIRAAVNRALADSALAVRARALAARQDLEGGKRLAVEVIESVAG